ncbi:hypothetical protein JCM5353_005339 [Sporobolomyces roseus]
MYPKISLDVKNHQASPSYDSPPSLTQQSPSTSTSAPPLPLSRPPGPLSFTTSSISPIGPISASSSPLPSALLPSLPPSPQSSSTNSSTPFIPPTVLRVPPVSSSTSDPLPLPPIPALLSPSNPPILAKRGGSSLNSQSSPPSLPHQQEEGHTIVTGQEEGRGKRIRKPTTRFLESEGLRETVQLGNENSGKVDEPESMNWEGSGAASGQRGGSRGKAVSSASRAKGKGRGKPSRKPGLMGEALVNPDVIIGTSKGVQEGEKGNEVSEVEMGVEDQSETSAKSRGKRKADSVPVHDAPDTTSTSSRKRSKKARFELTPEQRAAEKLEPSRDTHMWFPPTSDDPGAAIPASERQAFLRKFEELIEEHKGALDAVEIMALDRCGCAAAHFINSYPLSRPSTSTSTATEHPESPSEEEFLFAVLDSIQTSYGDQLVSSTKEMLHSCSHRSSAGSEVKKLDKLIWDLLVEVIKKDLAALPPQLRDAILEKLAQPRGCFVDGQQKHGYYPPTDYKTCWTTRKVAIKHPNDETRFSDLFNKEIPVPYGAAPRPDGRTLPDADFDGYYAELRRVQRRLIDYELITLVYGIKSGMQSIHSGSQASKLAQTAVGIATKLYGFNSRRLNVAIQVKGVKNDFGEYSAGTGYIKLDLVSDRFGNTKSILDFENHWCFGTVACNSTGHSFTGHIGMSVLDAGSNFYERLRTGSSPSASRSLFAESAAPRAAKRKQTGGRNLVRGLNRTIDIKKLRRQEQAAQIPTQFEKLPDWAKEAVQPLFPPGYLLPHTSSYGYESILGVFCRINAAKGATTRLRNSFDVQSSSSEEISSVSDKSLETQQDDYAGFALPRLPIIDHEAKLSCIVCAEHISVVDALHHIKLCAIKHPREEEKKKAREEFFNVNGETCGKFCPSASAPRTHIKSQEGSSRKYRYTCLCGYQNDGKSTFHG